MRIYQWIYSQTIIILMAIFFFRLYEICELNRPCVSKSQWQIVYLQERNMYFLKIQIHLHQNLLWALTQFLPLSENQATIVYEKQAGHHCPRSEKDGMRPRSSYVPQLEGTNSVEEWRLGYEMILVENKCIEELNSEYSSSQIPRESVSPSQTELLPWRTKC